MLNKEKMRNKKREEQEEIILNEHQKIPNKNKM